PAVSGVWRNFRVHLIAPPLVAGVPTLTLRRQSRSKWTMQKLRDTEWTDAAGLQHMLELIHKRANFLVVGATGSGKTSVLNACLQSLKNTERVVSIEDTSEVQLPSSSGVKLLTRTSSENVLRDYSQ